MLDRVLIYKYFSRKHSDTGSPKLSDRRSRLGSVFSEFSHKDDFDFDELAARRLSLSQQLLTQVLQSIEFSFENLFILT